MTERRRLSGRFPKEVTSDWRPEWREKLAGKEGGTEWEAGRDAQLCIRVCCLPKAARLLGGTREAGSWSGGSFPEHL